MTDDEPLVRWDWVVDHLDEVALRTLEHIGITVVAVAIGFAISLALAIAITRRRALHAPVVAAAGLLYTIPSLALFGLLIPVTGFSFLTLQVALVSYTILILVRNIVAGLDAVPAAVREAADGMGYEGWRRMLRIDLPLAAPTIIAGLRIATVTTIGLVTVTALIGLGGLGQLILDGLQRDFRTPLVVGSVLSIALAVAADLGLAGVERLITPWARTR